MDALQLDNHAPSLACIAARMPRQLARDMQPVLSLRQLVSAHEREYKKEYVETQEQIAVLNVKLEVIVAEICQSMLVWI